MSDLFEDRVEELRANLLDYSDSEVLEVLVRSQIIDENGRLTDYWLHLLSPDLVNQKAVQEEEDKVLSALADILKNRIK